MGFIWEFPVIWDFMYFLELCDVMWIGLGWSCTINFDRYFICFRVF